MNSRNRSAFTLVEILVVIVIIAMLTGLLLPAVNSARERARQATCANNQKNIASAVLQYEAAKQQFPGYINSLPVPAYASAGMGTPPTYAAVGWFPVLFPYLDRNDLWEGNETAVTPVHGWRTGLPDPLHWCA